MRAFLKLFSVNKKFTKFFILSIFIILQAKLNTWASENTPVFLGEKLDYANVYLKGVFSSWESLPELKFSKQASLIYRVSIYLVADGHPYDFKIADSKSMFVNCGGANNSTSVKLKEQLVLICEHEVGNLRFTPKKSGYFLFVLNVENNRYPTLVVSSLVDQQ
jgi:hypothetical protein